MRRPSLLRLAGAIALPVMLLSSCASVPMAPPEQDAASKCFPAPPGDRAGLYVYRSGSFGGALKKTLWIDGLEIGQTAPNVFLYRLIPAGQHVLATESEFGNNELEFTAAAGRNHFFRQYIKMGVFVGGSNLEAIDEERGRKAVSELGEALGTKHDTTNVRPGTRPPQPEKPKETLSSLPDGM